MKIAFLADLHIANHRAHGGPVISGINRRCRLALDALKRAVEKAEAEGCAMLFILGDVFDTTRPEPQVTAAVQQIINPNKMVVVIVEGNHDQISTDQGDHSLGPLMPVATVISDPTHWLERWHHVERNAPVADELDVWAVPFEPGPANEWLPRRLAELEEDRNLKNTPANMTTKRVLVTHLGISDHDTEPWMKATQDQVPAHLLGELAKQYGFSMVFAGNWHYHRVFNLAAPGFPKAVQVGTLIPTGWDNPGLKGHGTMPIWDTKTNELRVHTIPGPRFLTVNGQENAPTEWHDALKLRGVPYGDTQPMPPPNGWHLYVRIKTTADKLAKEQAWLEGLKTRGAVIDGEVVLDDVEVRGQARTAATVARSAETLQSALAGYVAEMPLPDGVDRAEVLARSQRYLAGGK